MTALDSITVLGYAMDPIEQLQFAMKEDEIERTFTDLARAVGKASKPETLTDDDRRNLSVSKQFFDYLYESLISSLDRDWGLAHAGYRTAEL